VRRAFYVLQLTPPPVPLFKDTQQEIIIPEIPLTTLLRRCVPAMAAELCRAMPCLRASFAVRCSLFVVRSCLAHHGFLGVALSVSLFTETLASGISSLA
jgi:hypothetical protein